MEAALNFKESNSGDSVSPPPNNPSPPKLFTKEPEPEAAYIDSVRDFSQCLVPPEVEKT